MMSPGSKEASQVETEITRIVKRLDKLRKAQNKSKDSKRNSL